MPKNHRLVPESRTIFAAMLAVLFLAGCQTALAAGKPRAVRPPLSSQAVGLICGDRAEIFGSLETKYRERPRFLGLIAGGMALEILTAPSGTWTALITSPRGKTCAIWFGRYWRDMQRPEGEIPL